MLWLERWDLEWMCHRVGTPTGGGIYRTLYLWHVEGQSQPAIAAELDCTRITVATRLNRWRRRILRHPWTERERPYLRAILDQSRQIEDRQLWEQAVSLHALLRGRRPSSPPAPVYDENGRQVAAPARLVTIWDVYHLLRVRQAREKLLGDTLNCDGSIEFSEKAGLACLG